ncbi:MAG: hypothetical protein IKS15_04350 [Opitutales bacterium]|nr:hypothetical protein [Opitutales bacterium]
MKKYIISSIIAIVIAIAAWEIYSYCAYKSYQRQALDNAAQFQKDMGSQLKNMNF